MNSLRRRHEAHDPGLQYYKQEDCRGLLKAFIWIDLRVIVGGAHRGVGGRADVLARNRRRRWWRWVPGRGIRPQGLTKFPSEPLHPCSRRRYSYPLIEGQLLNSSSISGFHLSLRRSFLAMFSLSLYFKKRTLFGWVLSLHRPWQECSNVNIVIMNELKNICWAHTSMLVLDLDVTSVTSNSMVQS